MPLYHWQGLDQYGTTQKGSLKAHGQQQAHQELAGSGIAVLTLTEAWFGLASFMQLLARPPAAYELHLFFAQLSAFVEAGIPLKQALKTASSLQSNNKLRSAITLATQSLEQGHPFHETLDALPYLPLYAQDLIRASETTGTLSQALESIAEMLLADHAYKTTLRNACNGPIITLITAGVITIGTITFLLPQFGNLYQQANITPPRIVAWSMALTSFLHAKIIVLICAGITAALVACKKTVQQISIVHLAAHLPFIKNTVISADILRWVSIMHAYTCNGLPLIEACRAAELQTVSSTSKKLIADCCTLLTEGGMLSSGLATTKLPAALFIKPLLLIGEETGSLAPMLGKAKHELALLMQQETSHFTSLVGPILTIGIGLVIGTLLVVLYLPIMQLGSLIR